MNKESQLRNVPAKIDIAARTQVGIRHLHCVSLLLCSIVTKPTVQHSASVLYLTCVLTTRSIFAGPSARKRDSFFRVGLANKQVFEQALDNDLVGRKKQVQCRVFNRKVVFVRD